MKKTLIIAVLLVLILTPALAARSFVFGAGYSFSGTSEAKTQAEINLVYRPLPLFVRLQGGLDISKDGLSWSGLKATANLELFKSMKNPLSFTMANAGPWSPAIAGGISIEGSHVCPYGEISLFRVLDKDYIYEWFVLSATFENGIREWSISFLRMTALF